MLYCKSFLVFFVPYGLMKMINSSLELRYFGLISLYVFKLKVLEENRRKMSLKLDQRKTLYFIVLVYLQKAIGDKFFLEKFRK